MNEPLITNNIANRIPINKKTIENILLGFILIIYNKQFKYPYFFILIIIISFDNKPTWQNS